MFLKSGRRLSVVASSLLLSVTVIPPIPASAQSDSVQARVEALLKQMTLEEKIGQLNQVPGIDFQGSGKPDAAVAQGLATSVLWVSNPKEINRLQRMAVEKTRLHIPLLIGLDVVQGYQTIFPDPLAMAATWDPDLSEQEQTIAAREARAAGINWAFGPMVDIARDARWGRIVEGAGEDPYLGAAMARAQVYGFQGRQLGGADRVLASVKHFAGYGAADGGRDYDSSYVAEEQLWNVYFPPFKAAIDAGVGSLMSAYMDLNDVPASGNKFLLGQVLRDTWHFDGFVVSDANAVGSLVTHGYARDDEDAAYKAFSAGVNVEMASGTYMKHLADLVKQGKVSVAQIDAAVRPVLAAKFRLGLFENPYFDESKTAAILSAPEHKRFARTAAQRSIVLLRNEGGLLPLPARGKYSSVAVIGPLADAHPELKGLWGGMISANKDEPVVSVLQGIREQVGQGVHVEYAKGASIRREIPSFFENAGELSMHEEPLPDAVHQQAEFDQAVATAKQCDLTVMVLGESMLGSGEAASRSSLQLQGRQQELLETVSRLGKPVVLVLVNGRPLDISWAPKNVPAIVEAWIPGVQGGAAIADVLFGAVNPGGKLPVSWPRSVGQEPIYYAHNLTQEPETKPDFTSRYYDSPTSPLFPFGYGLSYTTFAYSNLHLSNEQPKAGETVEVTVDIQNTGSRTGDTVAQLYVHRKAGSSSYPVRLLKGFERLTLAPGEKKTVTFHLGEKELSFWSPQAREWVEEPERFDIWVGDDSTAQLHSSLQVSLASN
jgi:beta-glucosidase